MKRFGLLLGLIAADLAGVAQSPIPVGAVLPAAPPTGYANLLAATIHELLTTSTPAQRQVTVRKLERAAAAAPTDWLPCYYQAYGYTQWCLNSPAAGEAKDAYLDQAEAALAQARQRGGDPAELLVLQAYIYQGRPRYFPDVPFGQIPGLDAGGAGTGQANEPG